MTAPDFNRYRGSPAEREDQQSGIKVGGKCVWKAQGYPIATITSVEIDEDGDPWFHLEFKTNDKPIRAERSEIAPTKFRAALKAAEREDG